MEKDNLTQPYRTRAALATAAAAPATTPEQRTAPGTPSPLEAVSGAHLPIPDENGILPTAPLLPNMVLGPICSLRNADRSSRSQTNVPYLHFVRPENHQAPILVYRCSDAQQTGEYLQGWLFKTFCHLGPTQPGVVRMENLELERNQQMADGQKAHLVLMEHACHLDGWMDQPAAILGLFIKGVDKVRWFYVLASPHEAIQNLVESGLINMVPRSIFPWMKRHCGLFIFIEQEIHRTFDIPHADAFKQAEAISNWCPGIDDPDSAFDRLKMEKRLQFAWETAEHAINIMDDRYFSRLHPSERLLAARTRLGCAPYLLLKLRFFRDFAREVFRSARAFDDRVVVRTEAAHRRWLEIEGGVSARHAEILVVGWGVLGFLDEEKYLGPDWALGSFQEFGAELDEMEE